MIYVDGDGTNIKKERVKHMNLVSTIALTTGIVFACIYVIIIVTDLIVSLVTHRKTDKEHYEKRRTEIERIKERYDV